MINGAVIALDNPPVTGKPIINVTISNASDQQHSISFYAIVDTGFTGFLTLGSSTIAQLGLSFITNQPLRFHLDFGPYWLRSARPGRAPVCPPLSITSVPLTAT